MLHFFSESLFYLLFLGHKDINTNSLLQVSELHVFGFFLWIVPYLLPSVLLVLLKTLYWQLAAELG